MGKNILINSAPLANIPWEDRPEGSDAVMWRYTQNPIIPHDLIPSSNSIFNSAVVPYEDGYAGVFRCDDKRRVMQLHAGKSEDGINWDLENDRIQWQAADEKAAEINDFQYMYDPRVVWVEETG